MSKGMYCSASQWIDSSSSASVISGRLIFLTITECPESPIAAWVHLTLCSRSSACRHSTMAPLSRIAPSTMACGGTGAMPKLCRLIDFPDSLSSTSLMECVPMSTPTTSLDLNNPMAQVRPLLRFRVALHGGQTHPMRGLTLAIAPGAVNTKIDKNKESAGDVTLNP